MGDVVRLAVVQSKAALNLRDAVIFLSCQDGGVRVRAPSVEDTPENRAELRALLKLAAEAVAAD